MELIIVLIIIAILATALIPSFLNFASRARDESLYAQARVGMVAAQVLLTEGGGVPVAKLPDSRTFEILGDNTTTTSFAGALNVSPDRFTELVKDDVANPAGFSNFVIASGGLRIEGITYNDGKDNIVVITP